LPLLNERSGFYMPRRFDHHKPELHHNFGHLMGIVACRIVPYWPHQHLANASAVGAMYSGSASERQIAVRLIKGPIDRLEEKYLLGLSPL